MTARGGSTRAPLSIALVHYAAPPVIGGVEQVLAHHAVLMADAGHAVRVVVARGGSLDERVALHSIPLMDPRDPKIIGLQSTLDDGRVPDDFAEISAQIADALQEALTDVDVVIAHNVCSLNLNLALTAALRTILDRPSPPRLILWHHDLARESPANAGQLHPGQPWDLLRTAWPGAAQVVVSEARRAELAALADVPADTILVIPNGIDVAGTLKLEPETEALLARLGVAEAVPLLLMPARITPRKNMELGLRVVAEMRRRGAPAGLVVTGPVDPHRVSAQAYMELLRDLRTTLGLDGSAWFLSEELGMPPSDAMVSDLFRLADVLFLPSRDEGFGLPMLEAAIARLPIVCADLPPLRELAGDAALYIKPDDDPGQVATRVLEALQADRVGTFARRVRTDYGWDALYRVRIAPLLADSAGTMGRR